MYQEPPLFFHINYDIFYDNLDIIQHNCYLLLYNLNGLCIQKYDEPLNYGVFFYRYDIHNIDMCYYLFDEHVFSFSDILGHLLLEQLLLFSIL